MSEERWLHEPILDSVRLSYKADRVLYESGTDHQSMVLLENKLFGRVLLLDGITQTTSGDEFMYHEMLAHVPLFAHGAPRSVLIVGGGDGGAAREVLRHGSVERLVQVEIDASVVEFSRAHLADIHQGSFDDPRFDLRIDDGARFVAETSERFDVVIVDSTDPVGPGKVLFEPVFYRNCARLLGHDGVLVNQSSIPFYEPHVVGLSERGLSAAFADHAFYLAAVPTYFGGFMALGFASQSAAARQVPLDELEHRFDAAGFATRYYAPEVHKAAFALPVYVKDVIARA
jgi:spermidine synthase